MSATTTAKQPIISSLPDQSFFGFLYKVSIDNNAMETYLKTVTTTGAAAKYNFMYNDPKLRNVNVGVKFTALTAKSGLTRIGNKDYGPATGLTSGLKYQIPIAASKTPLNYSLYATFPPNIVSFPILLGSSTSPNFNITARKFLEVVDIGGTTPAGMLFIVRFTDGTSTVYAPSVTPPTVSGIQQYGGGDSIFAPSGETSSVENPFSKITSLINSNSKPVTGGRRKQKYTRRNRH
jgi:hypothetical protein